MNQPRYVKTMQQLIDQATAKSEGNDFLASTVSQVVIDYKTDPELAAAILPPPLEARGDGLMRVVLSQVAMHISENQTMHIGSGVFGVHCNYQSQQGYYVVTMPMSSEAAVIGGREMYGEPKKIAEIEFNKIGNHVSSSISRHGLTYISFEGDIGDKIEAKTIDDKAFVFKAFPSVSGMGLEYEPQLMQLNLSRKQRECYAINGELILSDSPLDPVADLPIREVVSAVFEVCSAESNGEILSNVPAENLYPFLHQRYDDFAAMMAPQ